MVNGMYTRVEVCQLLGISMYSLMVLTRDGTIPCVRLGQKRLYEKAVINDIIGKAECVRKN